MKSNEKEGATVVCALLRTAQKLFKDIYGVPLEVNGYIHATRHTLPEKRVKEIMDEIAKASKTEVLREERNEARWFKVRDYDSEQGYFEIISFLRKKESE